jgi:hypothetical protein
MGVSSGISGVKGFGRVVDKSVEKWEALLIKSRRDMMVILGLVIWRVGVHFI